MPSQTLPCPIWDEPPPVRKIHVEGQIRGTNRAGGEFLLKRDGAALLQDLTCRQRANLSYWIYEHNLRHRLINTHEKFEEKPSWAEDLLELDETWVDGLRDHTPSAEDRMLMLLREYIRSDDAGVPADEADGNLLKAAGGCRHDDDLQELLLYALERGWLGAGGDPGHPHFPDLRLINLGLGARILVEEELRELGQERQGFVAMWFNPCMDEPYKLGIQSAIRDAGYEPRLINDRGFTGGVVDEILAEIRKSKFVVADFTSCDECQACEQCKYIGARGGVYFEAGFALGLGKTVFLTCREDRTEAVHFDVNHLNRIQWKTPGDLREQLRHSILAVLDQGPLDPPDGQTADRRQPERSDA